MKLLLSCKYWKKDVAYKQNQAVFSTRHVDNSSRVMSRPCNHPMDFWSLQGRENCTTAYYPTEEVQVLYELCVFLQTTITLQSAAPAMKSATFATTASASQDSALPSLESLSLSPCVQSSILIVIARLSRIIVCHFIFLRPLASPLLPTMHLHQNSKTGQGRGVDVHDSFDERNLVAVVHAGTSFEIVSSGVSLLRACGQIQIQGRHAKLV
jgi:hypothetical protein